MSSPSRLQRWILSLTGLLVVLAGLGEAITKFKNGTPFITKTISDLIAPPESSLSKTVEIARQRAREAAAGARAIAESYPREQVTDAVKQAATSVDRARTNLGQPKPFSGGKYWGTLADGQYSRMMWDNGTIEEGQFKSGKLNGYGRRTFGDGALIEGQFNNGEFSGYGCSSGVVSGEGDRTCGRFVNGEVFAVEEVSTTKGGKIIQRLLWLAPYRYSAVEFLSDVEATVAGTRYEGQIVQQIRNGYGIGYFPDGTRYEGQWANRRLEGLGAKVLANGDVQQAGMWQNGDLKQSK
jgi:hypothetical protein